MATRILTREERAMVIGALRMWALREAEIALDLKLKSNLPAKYQRLADSISEHRKVLIERTDDEHQP
jgi:hypothetical protein